MTAPKALIALLAMICLALQARLWFLDGNIPGVWRLKKEVSVQIMTVDQLKHRNQLLEAEVQDLKHRLGALEERARVDLGMIRQGETFFQVIPHEPQ